MLRPLLRQRRTPKLQPTSQWVGNLFSDLTDCQRAYSDRQPPKVVLPGTASSHVTRPVPPPPGPIGAAPGPRNAVPRVDTPPVRMQPPQIQTPPSAPTIRHVPTDPPRRGRFRRFLLSLVLLGGLGYAGGVYYSLENDNFHDFFTEYVPGGEDAVLFFEERQYRQRFPRVASPARVLEDRQITIPSQSGVSPRVTQDRPAVKDVSSAQRNPSQASADEKSGAIENAKSSTKPQAHEGVIPAKPSVDEPSQPLTNPSKKLRPEVDEPSQPLTTPSQQTKPQVDEPSQALPVPPLDPIRIDHADEPLVHDLVKMLNDIITVVNNDGAAHKYASTLRKAKEALTDVGTRILQLKENEEENARLRIRSLESQFDQSAKDLVARLEQELSAQQNLWRDDFDKESQRLSASYDSRLSSELSHAREVAEAHRQNTLLQQSVNLKQRFLDDVSARVDRERDGRLSKLQDLSSSVTELERLTADWDGIIDASLQSQHLQVAMEALRSSMHRAGPFVRELAAVKELAPGNDSLISAAIASINPSAYQRGIPSPAQLIDRFRRVAAEVRKTALVPDETRESNSAGVASHAASYMLSKLMFKKTGLTVGDDIESVLGRAETLLEEGQLDAATREVNTLRGWAKTLAWDWMCEARRVLEVQQAVDVIGAVARLEALRVEGSSR